ncbi:hypothetical protein [Desulfobacter vibrioformis]|uniref:hypothetical protein n=1 Tax=Desulfobacter vibrioformis TaxID=34031 RepID=UPI000554CEC0|nr:hypothetical protein [Desulfobacter vibrioformis]
MTDSSDLSSTEKLLDSIRGGTPPQAFSREPVSSLPESKGCSSLKGNTLNNLCAGAYLGGDSLSLVLAGETKRGGAKEVVKWQVFPYPETTDIKSERFPAFLRSALASFLADCKNVPIWAAIETKDVKLRQLTLPNIPDARLANAAMWALKKEIDIDLVNEIFDYEFISDVHGSGVKKKTVVAFSGDRAAVKGLKTLFKSAGYSLAGITATPFAIQNCILAGQPDTGGQPVVIVNIRRHRSEIFCMSEQGILVARSIKTGSYSLVEPSMESGMVDGKITDIPWILAARGRLDDPGFEEMEAAARRLLGKIQRTGEYCSNMFLENEPVAKYYFFGETDDSRAFISFSEEMIPGRVTLFSPFQNDPGAMGLAMPTSAADRNGVIPALGIALSDKAMTPNFLYTYKEKALDAKAQKINMGIIAAGIAGLLICAGVWFWFDRMENQEVAKRTSVETQLAKYDFQITKDVMNKKNDQARKKIEMIRQYVNDYASLSVISEVCALTPENIDILTLKAELAESVDNDPKAKNKKKLEDRVRHMRLQGLVSAEFTALESTLTGYVMALDGSPLFGNIDVENKKIEQKKDLNTLNFTVDMEIF